MDPGPASSGVPQFVSSGTSDNMLRCLKQGELDLVMAVTDTPPVTKPRHLWMRQAVWVRSDATRIEPDGPVPLVSYGEDCACQRVAVAALSQAGRRCDYVFTAVSLTSLAAAVSAGFGVLVMPRGRALRNDPAMSGSADLLVSAPFAGVVVSIAHSAEEHVGADAPLLVLEAMKMEHEITAPVAGTVTELRVTAGAQVEAGAVLAVIE